MLVPDPETGCLLWTGVKDRRGYGQIKIGGHNGRNRRVHRVAWELDNGPVPDDLELDHVWDRGCRHKHCANLAHLELVTSAENTRRGIAAHGGKNFNAAKTHCPQGHPYDEENTFYANDRTHRHGVHRMCRICMRENKIRRRARVRQSVLAG